MAGIDMRILAPHLARTTKKWGLLLLCNACISGCSQIAMTVAARVYPDLSQPWNRETAPTVTSFPASSQVRAVVGGRGEGVGCSIPPLAEALMFNADARQNGPVSLQFRQACVFHDMCYRHGNATYGYSKSDCDELLVEYAYRTCRQIYPADPGEKTCQDRARVMLLGVDLFGGGSFAYGYRSTYFEFDPFPRRADDYVAARAIRTQQEVSLWSFYFKAGWMRMKRHFHGAPTDEGKVPFAMFKVPVPPFLVGGTPERLVWITRRGLNNSGVSVFEVEADSPKGVVAKIGPRFAEPEGEDLTCTSSDRHNRRLDGFAQLEFDCNTSVTKPVLLPCDGARTKTLVVTAGHAGLKDGFPVPQRQHQDEVCNDKEHALALSATKLRIPPFEKDTERFMHGEFLVGPFRSGAGEWDLLAFGRGFKMDATGTPDQFRKSAVVAGRPLSVGAPYAFRLDLPEDLEPVVPFKADGSDILQLIALSVPSEASALERINIREFELASNQAVVSRDRRLELQRDWLRQPAQVLATSGGGDRLFFSRVSSTQSGMSLDDADFIPEVVRLETRTFRRAEADWTPTGGQCVEVHISDQMLAMSDRPNKPGAPLNRYLHDQGLLAACAALSTEEIRAQIGGAAGALNTASSHDADRPTQTNGARACASLRRDMASRWHRSQVIATEDVNPPSLAGGSPSAIFVFNGFPGQSVWVNGEGHPAPSWAKSCRRQ